MCGIIVWGVGEGVKRGGFEGGKRGWNGVGVMLERGLYRKGVFLWFGKIVMKEMEFEESMGV